MEAVALPWDPGSHGGQNLHQLSHVVPQVAEVRLRAEVLQAHLGQDLLVLLGRADEEPSGKSPQVSDAFSE